MKYSQLGNTGLIVSRMALGAMTFGVGEFRGLRTSVTSEMADEMVGLALDAGINFFDTADMYGRGISEKILGESLGERRQDVVLATKVGVRMGDQVTNFGLSASHIIQACEASLKRLATDYIDLYQLHFYDHITPLEEITRALELLVQQGKVRYTGYSNFPAWQAATAVGIQKAKGYSQFVSAQMYYSLLCRDLEQDVIPFLQSAGLGLMVWSPLSGGFLTGKYTKEDPTGGDGRLRDFTFPPINKEAAYDVIDVVEDIAANHNASNAQVALAWLLSKKHVTTVIIGANKIEHFKDNIGAAELILTADELAQLDEITATRPLYPHWMNARTGDAYLENLV